MHLEALTQEALRRLPAGGNGAAKPVSPMDGLLLLRQQQPSSFDAMLYEPVLCLILQGRKELAIGERSLAFGAGECLLVSHRVPVVSRITTAPYLALVFELDMATLRGLCAQAIEPEQDRGSARAAQTHRADAALLDALHRYLSLAESPADAKVLGPLVAQEIHYRLLVAPFGGMLRSLLRQDSAASAIARALGQLRSDIRSPVSVQRLAREIGMSTSSFHQHFRRITSTTPLQYLKELRLLEARRLLQTCGASVTAAAFEVGYESPSQFSREYARKFGVPPSQHLANTSTPVSPVPAPRGRAERRSSEAAWSASAAGAAPVPPGTGSS
jgi:AraC-like DNA-binding protein